MEKKQKGVPFYETSCIAYRKVIFLSNKCSSET